MAELDALEEVLVFSCSRNFEHFMKVEFLFESSEDPLFALTLSQLN
jgi:hypothetical protein